MSSEINRPNFQKEITKLALSCINAKEDTAKRKAASLFKKYFGIIEYDLEMTKSLRDSNNQLYKKKEILKSGKIDYISGNVYGKIFIKDVEQVESSDKGVLLIMKGGREIQLSSDFQYLIDIF
jgi:hypothetical protein